MDNCMILDIVKSFLEIVDYSFKIKDRLIPPLDKESISYFLLKISELLSSVADDLEQSRYPHDKCGEMWSYMNSLQDKLKVKFDKNDLNSLNKLIHDCYQVELLLGQLNNLSQELKILNINKLREASGKFKAASELIKI